MLMYNNWIVISSEEGTPQSSGEEGNHAANNQQADLEQQSDWVAPTAIRWKSYAVNEDSKTCGFGKYLCYICFETKTSLILFFSFQ